MDDEQRRPGCPGEGDRPARRLGFDVRRPRRRVVAGTDLAGGEVAGRQRLEDRPVLAVHLQHPTASTRRLERPEDQRIVEAEVVDHECLEGRDAGVDRGGNLRDRILVGGRDDEAGRDVHGRIARRRGTPFAEPGHQRACRRRGRPGAGVVEGEERRRATEGRGDRVVEEAVGPRICRDAGVGVDVDDPGEDEEAARVDDLPGRRRETFEIGFHGGDPAALDGDVGARRTLRRDHDAAPDEQIGHGLRGLEDLDLLGAFPQAPSTDLAEAIGPALVGLDRGEVVGRQLADLRRRGARPVGEEYLALADPAG